MIEINPNKSFSERLAEFDHQQVVDITLGLPFARNGEELYQWYVANWKKGKIRFPIIGFDDGRVIMMGGNNNKFFHKRLVDLTGSYQDDQVTFATAIEGISPNKPSIHHLEIKLDDSTVYFILQDRSDYYDLPIKPAKQPLSKIFDLPRVKVKFSY